jgi:hypothetical protein
MDSAVVLGITAGNLSAGMAKVRLRGEATGERGENEIKLGIEASLS